MRLKLFALFVALEVAGFGGWSWLHREAPAEAAAAAPLKSAALSAPAYSHLRLSARNENQAASLRVKYGTEDALKTLDSLPKNHTATLKNLVLDYSPQAHRGLGGENLIILRAVNMGANEFGAVLTHEMGHNVDAALLKPAKKIVRGGFKDGDLPVYETDPSLLFYRISWASETERLKNASNLDFVSGYAMQDPFEDFAETYTFYRLHNLSFRALTAKNDALARKYAFMRDMVFAGETFKTGKAEDLRLFLTPRNLCKR